MPTLSQPYLRAAFGILVLLSSALNANAKDLPKPDIASYSYSDGVYTETVTLRADGRYAQQETERPGSARLLSIIHGGHGYGLPSGMKYQLSGVWCLLDGPGGKPLPLPTSAAALPHGVVVVLLHALPFGLTWENQDPMGLKEDRVIPANEFTVPPPAVSAFAPGKVK